MTKEAKKYPCLFGLIKNCEARRFLEQGLAEDRELAQARKIARQIKEAGRVVEHMKFDDAESLKRIIRQMTPAFEEMGMAMARGFGTRFQVMVDFCRMCPKRSRRAGGPPHVL